LLGAGRAAEALAVLTWNAEAYPESANAHDSRGEALAEVGDTAASIREYETTLRLDPRSRGAAEKLAVLRGAARRP
jgi:predicted TPR repeat methyltransferase